MRLIFVTVIAYVILTWASLSVSLADQHHSAGETPGAESVSPQGSTSMGVTERDLRCVAFTGLGVSGIWLIFILFRNRRLHQHINCRDLDGTVDHDSERSLQTKMALYKNIIDNLPIGVAVNSVDPTVDFSYMNDNFPRFYRTSKEALTDPDVFWDSVYEDPTFREEIRKRVLADCNSGDRERMHWEDVPLHARVKKRPLSTPETLPFRVLN